MHRFVATYNPSAAAKFEAAGARAQIGTALTFDAKGLTHAHTFFRDHVLEHFGVALDAQDYSIYRPNQSPPPLGFLENPNPPRVQEKPGRAGDFHIPTESSARES